MPRVELDAEGLIPACAGTTSRSVCHPRLGRAHPRLRGDHPRVRVPGHTPHGSSPPARGPPRPARMPDSSPRLIPACAGTTLPGGSLSIRIAAHPRLRGDHAQFVHQDAGGRGSSPPARGPQELFVPIGGRHGLIPACAGTTQTAYPPGSWRRAHPRLRGDHLNQLLQGRNYEGSSPPARGPLLMCIHSVNRMRLIPACAGTTYPSKLSPLRLAAHPRLRGDHPGAPAQCTDPRGSSPPARGPLRAVFRRWRRVAAHPRLRGDHGALHLI